MISALSTPGSARGASIARFGSGAMMTDGPVSSANGSNAPKRPGPAGASPRKKKKRTPLYRKLLLTLAVPLAMLLIVEAGLRIAGVDHAASFLGRYRGFRGEVDHFIVEPGADGRLEARTRPMPKALFGREQLNPARFPATPPPGTRRILVFGGSAVYGWPYDGRFSFSAWLDAGFDELPGGKAVEIINLGAPGYGSRRVAALVDEALAFAPDTVLVLTGHNEVLESEFSETVLDLPEGLLATHLFLLKNLRLYGTMLHLGRSLGSSETPAAEGRESTLPRTYDANRTRITEAAFEANLTRIVKACRERGVEVVLGSLPANLRDVPPVGAFPPGGERVPAARLETLLEERPEDARLHFRLGRALLEAGRGGEAREHLTAARDLDPCGLRVTSGLNRIIRETALREGARYFPLRETLEGEAQFGLLGYDLFLDNCHPSPEGQPRNRGRGGPVSH